MHAYYFDNLPTDQRLPHITDPARPVSPETLAKLGVLSWVVPVPPHAASPSNSQGISEEEDCEVNRVAKERGYKNRDVINVSREGMGAVYDEKIRGFFEEHMHEDEEIRYILSGSGFFDVREMPTDAWIRIAVAPGDLLVLPAGIYHRFTLDTKDQIRALRLFKVGSFPPLLRFSATSIRLSRVATLGGLTGGWLRRARTFLLPVLPRRLPSIDSIPLYLGAARVTFVRSWPSSSIPFVPCSSSLPPLNPTFAPRASALAPLPSRLCSIPRCSPSLAPPSNAASHWLSSLPSLRPSIQKLRALCASGSPSLATLELDALELVSDATRTLPSPLHICTPRNAPPSLLLSSSPPSPYVKTARRVSVPMLRFLPLLRSLLFPLLFPMLPPRADEPKWIPHARSAGTDANVHRVGYLRDVGAVGA
ncbi:1,2-dihydroxy-3-keto-5-methylthiopentene dioxygenase [Mycena sanguinolenta]|uniref:Acireductone dioxygenase n=1 Tax=Mycena sanguinolenta TaxID=230812 RepID=A0A8H7CWZ9_9AGAR|nr:1,2-dihydroxy-3-keto-5-methylthiopentene dioxygenase [Mycena sanguinolenta]